MDRLGNINTESRIPVSRLEEVLLTLDLPHFQENLEEQAYLSEEMRLRARQSKEGFQNAHEIVAVTGTFGLGDCIMELRYILLVAKNCPKKILCQVHPSLLPLVQLFTSIIPNISFCEKVPSHVLDDPKKFLLKITPKDELDAFQTWIDWPENASPKKMTEFIKENEKIKVKKQQGQAVDSGLLLPLYSKVAGVETAEEVFANLGLDRVSTNHSDQYYATILDLLGIGINEDEAARAHVIPFASEIISTIPQTLDFVIVPDAKERDTNKVWSNKSFPPNVWDKIFSRPELQNKKIGIVIGTSHRNYSQAVLTLAKKNNLQIEIIEGDLQHIAKNILACKCFIGMDSGTTHLALDVQRFAKSHGRQIYVKEVIDTFRDTQVEEYGLVNIPILRFIHADGTQDFDKNFSTLSDDEIKLIGDYFLK